MDDQDKLNFGTMNQKKSVRSTYKNNEFNPTGDRIRRIGSGCLIAVTGMTLLILGVPVVLYSIDSPASICLTILGSYLLVLFGILLFQKIQNSKRSVIPNIAAAILILYIVALLIVTIGKL